MVFSFIAWSFFGLHILESARTLWYPYVGAYVLGAIGETLLVLFPWPTNSANGHRIQAYLGLHYARTALANLLAILAIWVLLETRTRKSLGVATPPSGEASPLLVNGDANTEPSEYRSVIPTEEDDIEASSATKDKKKSKKQKKYDSDGDTANESSDSEHESENESDSDDDDNDKKVKKERQQRLKQAGYVKVFLEDMQVLFRLVWPNRLHYVHLCILAEFFNVVAGRFYNVLQAHLYGLVVDTLINGKGSGHFPVKPFFLWALIAWAKSECGLGLFVDILSIFPEQYAHKSIGVNAFKHVVGLSADYHHDKSSPEIINGIQQGQGIWSLFNWIFTRIVPTFFDLGIGFLYITWLFDFNVTLVLVLASYAFVWIGFKSATIIRKYRRKELKLGRKEKKRLTETIYNWTTVASLGRGRFESERYEKAINKYQRSEIWTSIARTLAWGLESFVTELAFFSVMAAAIWQISRGNAPIGHLVTLISFWSVLTQPLSMIGWAGRHIGMALTDTETLLHILRTKPTVQDKPDAVPIVVTDATVQVKNVSFGYDKRKLTIKDVSFTAQGGKTIAFVGQTGGGKTTILNLLYRMYDVGSGQILIDGQDVRDVTQESLRDVFGIVPQHPSLFNISLLDNLRYANLDATNEEIYEACKAACIHDKILTFPDGYASKTGERGVKLSGGELQRVAIARAILRNPKIVILDESTASVDSITESKIQEAIGKLGEDRTIFVIAHRLATIQNADQIVVIEEGQVVETGTHDELFAAEGRYFELWSAQSRKEDIAKQEAELRREEELNAKKRRGGSGEEAKTK